MNDANNFLSLVTLVEAFSHDFYIILYSVSIPILKKYLLYVSELRGYFVKLFRYCIFFKVLLFVVGGECIHKFRSLLILEHF